MNDSLDMPLNEASSAGDAEAWAKAPWKVAASYLAGPSSHEIRNTLFTLNAIIELAQLKHPEQFTPEFKTKINTCTEAASAELSMLDAVMDPLVRESSESLAINDLLDTCMKVFARKHRSVHFDCSCPNLHVNAYRSDFLQAVLCLFDNAASFAPAGNVVIRIQGHCLEQQLLLEISDNGSGMTDRVRRQAFEPFFTTRRHHLGLGLCLARAAFKRIGGDLTIQETGADGTVFVGSLPISARWKT